MPDSAVAPPSEDPPPGLRAWRTAGLAAAVFAIDPRGLGGVVLRAQVGPVRTRWTALLKALLPADLPVRRVPAGISDDRLIGGLDLTATLRSGKPVAEKGLLAEADGGVLVLAMAERLSPAAAARIALTLDSGEVAVERDGLAARLPARFGVVAEDEGLADEAPPVVLTERLGLFLDLERLSLRDLVELPLDAEKVAAARALLSRVEVGEGTLEALCGTAVALGIASLRAPLRALRAACALAALSGRTEVEDADVETAAALVLAPRATRVPMSAQPNEPEEETPPSESEPSPEEPRDDSDAGESSEPDLSDRVLEAAAAAISRGLLDKLKLAGQGPRGTQTAGTAGVAKLSLRRGRPIGAHAGRPRPGVRLNLVETLRAAAPWQRLRRPGTTGQTGARIAIRAEDFRVTRFKQRSETATIFAVDASGSTAFNRLAEAKGAVELLLADCYVRRDQVALLAFRGSTAELLLPPTRSLVRTKRALAALPGGGGTPLAAGIDAAAGLGIDLLRRGITPLLVFLTDGQANIARDGQPGRPQAREDAEAAARRLANQRLTALLIDTSARPNEKARSLAAVMEALYLPLPQADARKLDAAVRATLAG
ncbi:magnesium chelatase subunit D [Algihabitans albus]|uniref:magnesium chelatase subunit D n=1 Tax=Algihabitans albus TaxID=2164067 RepID=UPI000E5CDFB6|nr:magnesium chelatase subunit D [Algihabitans albus]